MAYAIVSSQTATGSNTGGITTVAVAYPGTTTAGNTLVCAVGYVASDTTITMSASDGTNGSWTAGPLLASTGVGKRIQIFFFANTAGSVTPTVTVTASSAVSSMVMGISEWSGGATASIHDADSAGADDSGANATLDPGSLTTTVSGDLLVAAVLWETDVLPSGSPPPLTAGSGFTELSDVQTGSQAHYISIQYQVAGASGSQAMAWTNTGTFWVAVGTSLKPAGGDTSTTQQRMVAVMDEIGNSGLIGLRWR